MREIAFCLDSSVLISGEMSEPDESSIELEISDLSVLSEAVVKE